MRDKPVDEIEHSTKRLNSEELVKEIDPIMKRLNSAFRQLKKKNIDDPENVIILLNLERLSAKVYANVKNTNA